MLPTANRTQRCGECYKIFKISKHVYEKRNFPEGNGVACDVSSGQRENLCLLFEILESLSGWRPKSASQSSPASEKTNKNRTNMW